MINLSLSGGSIIADGPEWAKGFFDWGQFALEARDESKKRLIAFVVPSRCFVSSLLALGAVMRKMPETTVEANLWKLEVGAGTPCLYPHGGKLLRWEVHSRSSDRSLMLVPAPGSKHIRELRSVVIPEARLNRLLFVEPDSVYTSLSTQLKGRQALEALLGSEASYAYYGQRGIDALICGGIEEVLTEAQFVDVDCQSASCTALQLLRPRTTAGQLGYRSEIITSIRAPKRVHSSNLTIFDGAHGYLNWGVGLSKTNLVVLDNSSPSQGRFRDAVERIWRIRDYGSHIKGELPTLPPQVEVIAVDY
jgi:hypothetical protein